MILVPAPQLHAMATQIFRAAGAGEEATAILVDHLIAANLAGHDSHGVHLIPWYVSDIREGKLLPNAHPTIVQETPVAALIDGGLTFGQVAAEFATDVAIAKAKRQGISVVGLVNSHHIGRLGTYPSYAARQGIVLMLTTGDLGELTAPYGGRKAVFGTNPFSFGFPAADRPDLLVDFATSTIAGGKVMVARAKHEALPTGSLIDKDGNPTTDPDAYFSGGALLPFGGHKGSALATLSVLLSQVLVPGGEWTGKASQTGTFMLAIDAGLFRDPGTVREETDLVFARIKEVPPTPGFAEVLVPGEPEVRSAERRGAEGIPIPDDTWTELTATATSLGLALT